MQRTTIILLITALAACGSSQNGDSGSIGSSKGQESSSSNIQDDTNPSTSAALHSNFQLAYSADANGVMAEAESYLSNDFGKCRNEEPLGCVGDEFDRQDALLNSVYKQAMRRISSSEQDELRSKQRQWIENRDAHCESESENMGSGSVAERQVYCLTIETIHRTNWLKSV